MRKILSIKTFINKLVSYWDAQIFKVNGTQKLKYINMYQSK